MTASQNKIMDSVSIIVITKFMYNGMDITIKFPLNKFMKFEKKGDESIPEFE